MTNRGKCPREWALVMASLDALADTGHVAASCSTADRSVYPQPCKTGPIRSLERVAREHARRGPCTARAPPRPGNGTAACRQWVEESQDPLVDLLRALDEHEVPDALDQLALRARPGVVGHPTHCSAVMP